MIKDLNTKVHSCFMCKHQLKYASIHGAKGNKIVLFRCIKCRKIFEEKISEEDEIMIKRDLLRTPEERLKDFFRIMQRQRKIREA